MEECESEIEKIQVKYSFYSTGMDSIDKALNSETESMIDFLKGISHRRKVQKVIFGVVLCIKEKIYEFKDHIFLVNLPTNKTSPSRSFLRDLWESGITSIVDSLPIENIEKEENLCIFGPTTVTFYIRGIYLERL